MQGDGHQNQGRRRALPPTWGPVVRAYIARGEGPDLRCRSVSLGAEDAARVCALVSAVPARIVGDCATLGLLQYGRSLYNKLRAIRNYRIGAITAAYERGEAVKHALGQDDPR